MIGKYNCRVNTMGYCLTVKGVDGWRNTSKSWHMTTDERSHLQKVLYQSKANMQKGKVRLGELHCMNLVSLKRYQGTGARAQWLGTLVALAEDLDWVPKAVVMTHDSPHSSCKGFSAAAFLPLRTPDIHVVLIKSSKRKKKPNNNTQNQTENKPTKNSQIVVYKLCPQITKWKLLFLNFLLWGHSDRHKCQGDLWGCVCF